MPEVECQSCFWQGDVEDLTWIMSVAHCPECGSDDICDYELDDEELDE